MGIFEHFPYTNFHDLNLDWILQRVEEVYKAEEAQNETIAEQEKAINELRTLFNNFKTHGFEDYYIDKLRKWFNYYLHGEAQAILKQYLGYAIWFGLDENGYVVAYVADSLGDLNFATPRNYEDDNYGRLTINY